MASRSLVLPLVAALLVAGDTPDAERMAWWEGCHAEGQGPGLAILCPDRFVGVHESLQTAEVAIAGLADEFARRGRELEPKELTVGGRSWPSVRIQPRGADAELVVVAVEPSPGRARVIMCDTSGVDGEAICLAVVADLAAHGAPPLRGLLSHWETVQFRGRALAVPDGCRPESRDGAARIICGFEMLEVAPLGADPGRKLSRSFLDDSLASSQLEVMAEGRVWHIEKARCRLNGEAASCRTVHEDPKEPTVAPDRVVAVQSDGTDLWFVKCEYVGPELPAVCAQLVELR